MKLTDLARQTNKALLAEQLLAWWNCQVSNVIQGK